MKLKKVDFPTDIDRLRAVAWAAGLLLSRTKAARFWARYSQEMCASWHRMGDFSDAELLTLLLSRTETRRID